MAPQPPIKLIYFNLRARGEALRMMLTYSGKEWVDEVVTFDEWRNGYKEKMPEGKTGKKQLPVLVLPDDESNPIPESLDIAKLIAAMCDPPLTGTSPEEKAKAEKLFLLSDTENTEFGHGYNNFGRINPLLNFFSVEESSKQIPEFLQALPTTLTYLAKELGSGPYFCGNTLTYADFCMFHYLDSICTLDGGTTIQKLKDRDAADALQAFMKRMETSKPAVAQYLKNRPQPGTGQVGGPGSILATQTTPHELPIIQETLARLYP